MPQSLLATTTHHEHLVRHTSGKRGSRRILQEAFQNDGSLTRMQGSLQSDTTDLANVQYTRHRLGGAMRSTRYHCVCSGLSHAYRQIDGAIQDRQHWHWRSGAYTLIITDSILLNGTIPVTMPGHTSVPAAAAAAILQQLKQQQGKSYRCARMQTASNLLINAVPDFNTRRRHQYWEKVCYLRARRLRLDTCTRFPLQYLHAPAAAEDTSHIF